MIKNILFALLLLVCRYDSLAVNQHLSLPEIPQQPQLIVNSGHTISRFDITKDGDYIITSDWRSLSLWSVKERVLLKQIKLEHSDFHLHPTNPRLVYARQDVYSAWKSQRKEDIFMLFDMFTGEVVGAAKRFELEPLNKYSSNNTVIPPYLYRATNRESERYTFLLESNGITVKDNMDNRVAWRIESKSEKISGSMEIEPYNGLLLIGGLEPEVWDLQQIRLMTKIPYVDYIKQDPNIQFVGDYKLPVKNKITSKTYYGDRSYCDSHFLSSNEIIVGGYNEMITIWDTSGRLKRTIKSDSYPTFSICLPDSTKADNMIIGSFGVGVGNSTSDRIFINPESRNELSKKNETSQTNAIAYDKVRNRYYYGAESGVVKYGALDNTNVSKVAIQTGKNIQSLLLTPDNKKMVIVTGKGAFSVNNDDVINPIPFPYELHAKSGFLQSGCIIDNKNFLVGDGLGNLFKYEIGDFRPIGYVKLHSNKVTGMALSKDRKTLYTTSYDGNISVLDVDSLKVKLTLTSFEGNTAYIAYTPDLYYKMSTSAINELYFGCGVDVFRLDQFDIIYNRPDIILSRMGASNEEVDKLYRLWEKRLQKMGFNKDMLKAELHVPDVKIVSKPSYRVSKNRQEFSVELSDSKYSINSFIIKINGVPVQGEYNLIPKNKNKHLLRFNLDLVSGENKIEFSCINEKGVESYRRFTEIYNEEVNERRVYIIASGVSRYQDKKFNLTYASKDAIDVADCFTKKIANQYKSVKTLMLTDEQVSSDRFLPNVSSFLKEARRDDLVIFFFAGHGVLDANLDYYLAPSDMDFTDPKKRGIAYDDINNIFNEIAPLYKLCFIDACHSGEIDKEDVFIASNNTQTSESIVFRGMDKYANKSETQNLMSELFCDLRQNNGTNTIASSNGTEVSLEGGRWKNGLFTYGLMKSIEDLSGQRNQLSVFALFNKIKAIVSTQSQGLQTPVFRQRNKEIDFNF